MAFDNSVLDGLFILCFFRAPDNTYRRYADKSLKTASYFYDGRLLNAPSISIARDSQEFGILVYTSSAITLSNVDGHFDDLAATLIGNKVYIAIADGISVSEFLFTGYVESVNVNEKEAVFNVSDLRKRLKGNNTTDIGMYTDAVTAIENILIGTYGTTAISAYLDATALTAAKALAPLIYRPAPENDTVEDAIEDCVKSTMGFFLITSEGKYSYKMIDTDATSVTTISHYDILNEHNIEYNTEEITAKLTLSNDAWTEPYIDDDAPTSAYEVAFGVSSNILNNSYSTETVLIKTGRFVLEACSMASILRSTNLGQTYTVIPLVAGAYSTATSPYQSLGTTIAGTAEDIYVVARTNATVQSLLVYKSTDTGLTFTKVASATSSMQAYPTYQNAPVTIITGIDNSIILSYEDTSDEPIVDRLAYGASTMTAITPALAGPGSTSAYSIIITGTLKRWGGTPNYDVTATSIIIGQAKYLYSSVIYDTGIYTNDYGASWNFITGGTITTGTKGAVSFDKCVIVTPTLWFFYCSIEAGELWLTRDAGTSFELLYSCAVNEDFKLGPILTNMGIYFTINVRLGYDRYTIKTYRFIPNTATEEPSTTIELVYSVDSELYSNVSEQITYFNSYRLLRQSNYLSDFVYVANNSLTESTSLTTLQAAYGVDTFKAETILAYNTTDMTTLLEDKYNYFNTLHGKLSITVPIKYYYLNVGDNVDVEIWRETVEFLGTVKCEIMSKSYDLNNALITFGLRII